MYYRIWIISERFAYNMKLINVGIKNNIPHIIKLGICEKDFFLIILLGIKIDFWWFRNNHFIFIHFLKVMFKKFFFMKRTRVFFLQLPLSHCYISKCITTDVCYKIWTNFIISVRYKRNCTFIVFINKKVIKKLYCIKSFIADRISPLFKSKAPTQVTMSVCAPLLLNSKHPVPFLCLFSLPQNALLDPQNLARPPLI